MGFLGIYRAAYDYAPQAETELPIDEGDLLFVLEKNDDDEWWKAKKKASADDEDEPVGLVPNNYLEEARPIGRARALYEYTRQTDEELSFPEDAGLDVYDTSDPDWMLVGVDGDFGFVPSNYIELESAEDGAQPIPPSLPKRFQEESVPPDTSPADSPQPAESRVSTGSGQIAPISGPAAALASVMQGRDVPSPASRPVLPSHPPQAHESPQEDTSDASDDDARSPPLPVRPSPAAASPRSQPRQRLVEPRHDSDDGAAPSSYRTAGGFHMYNINEMVSVMGKRKKMPTTLGINLGAGTIMIAPERSQDGPSQEWTADKMTHYSREGKHVFMEFVRPSKSVDFHGGAKDTAEEIVAALAELSGAVKAEGLREVMMAATGQSQKKGQVLYDFMAQGDDEVTVSEGDEVIIIDDTKSEEWWQVRRLKNGKEGVVPSSYIEVTGVVTPPPSSAGLNSGRSTVEQNRQEEIRLTKEAVIAHQKDASQQVGPGMSLPERGSSLLARENGSNSSRQRNKRDHGRLDGGSQAKSKSKPDPSKVRMWTDRSKSFSVEAQFLGLKDGKLNLHKMNGVKIAVPVSKMSHEDLDYVERLTGLSLNIDKASGTRRTKPGEDGTRMSSQQASRPGIGASVDRSRKADHDWFQFFLDCQVAPGLCERYAQAFDKDSMDESVLPDVDAGVLRTLGLREGDILKVMRVLDTKYGRAAGKNNRGDQEVDGESNGQIGLFSGPGGTLRNNTKSRRPTPAVQTNDVVDPKAFAQKGGGSGAGDGESRNPGTSETGSSSAADMPQAKGAGGFDDDAWDVKPAKQQPPPTQSAPTASGAPIQAQAKPSISSGSLQDLSLLTAPLEPTRARPPTSADDISIGAQSSGASQAAAAAAANAVQPPGATPSFFGSLPAHQTGLPARQRPQPPQYLAGPASLISMPPSRPLSAPQSAQPSAFQPPPLAAHMTGVQGQVAPPGQSLSEINQARLQQQYAQHLQQSVQSPAMAQYTLSAPAVGLTAFPTGIQAPPGQMMQPLMTGVPQLQSPFADPLRQAQFSTVQPQSTGFPGPFPAPSVLNPPVAAGINSYLPPALEPQRTAMPGFPHPQPMAGGMPQVNSNVSATPVPAPLQPQQTGPPPPVRFGVQKDVARLATQPTGRRANLSQATPQNPFGF